MERHGKPSLVLRGLVLVLVLVACGAEPRPDREAQIVLTLTLTRDGESPDSPVTVTARVENLDDRAVQYVGGCDCFSPYVSFLDPDGESITYWDPCRVRLGCPCGPAKLEPGGSLLSEWHFSGTEWSEDRCSTLLPLPGGSYTARAGFLYEVAGTSYSVSRSETFSWEVAAGTPDPGP